MYFENIFLSNSTYNKGSQSVLKGGGSSFRFSCFFTSKWPHSFIFSPNLPLWGLKMTLQRFLKFITFFLLSFWGNSQNAEFFFSKNIFIFIFYRSRFLIFLTRPVLNERQLNFAYSDKEKPKVGWPLDGPQDSEYRKMTLGSVFLKFLDPRRGRGNTMFISVNMCEKLSFI